MINYKNISEYINSAPDDIKTKLNKLNKIIKTTVPEADETISYGMPTFKLNGKNLVHFAGYKNHIGFYPTPSALVAFEKELSMYKTSKGTAQFEIDKELPIKLIEKMIKYRIEENIKLQQ